MADKTELSHGLGVGAAEAVITDLLSLEYRGRHHGPPRHAGDLLGALLLFTDGKTELLLISLDLLELYEPWLERFHAAVERCTGIPPASQFVWCNHIHASPSSDGVPEIPLAERLAPAVEEARENAARAECAFGSRSLGPGWTINRRFNMGGLGAMCVMFNDNCRVEDCRLEVTGQVMEYLENRGVPAESWSGQAFCEAPDDVRLEVLSLRNAKNRAPVANVVRFPAHPAIASAVKVGNTLFPDYVGALRDTIKRRFGGVVFFVQGPSGDIRPLHEEYGIEAANAFGKRLATEAAGLISRLSYKPLESAAGARTHVTLTLRPEYLRDQATLEREQARIRSEIESFSGRPAQRMALLRSAEELRWVGFFRRERPTILPLAALVGGKWTTGVAALRLGDVFISALPGEIFQATGWKLLARAPENTMVTELFESYISYLPSEEELGTGGYEDTSSFFSPGAQAALLEAAHSAIDGLRG